MEQVDWCHNYPASALDTTLRKQRVLPQSYKASAAKMTSRAMRASMIKQERRGVDQGPGEVLSSGEAFVAELFGAEISGKEDAFFPFNAA